MQVGVLEYVPRTFSQNNRIVSQGIVRIYAIYYTLALILSQVEILSDQEQRRDIVWLSCNATKVTCCDNATHDNRIVDPNATTREKGTTPKKICDNTKSKT